MKKDESVTKSTKQKATTEDKGTAEFMDYAIWTARLGMKLQADGADPQSTKTETSPSSTSDLQ